MRRSTAACSADDRLRGPALNAGVAPSYEACGMPRVKWAVGREASDWELFTVNESTGDG